MINIEESPQDNLQVVDGTFRINTDEIDDGAFFNLNMNNKIQQNPKEQSFNFSNLGGIPTGIGFTNSGKSNIMTTAAPSPVNASAKCNHNCNSCVWSFLCNSAAKGMSGSSAPTFKIG